MKKFIVVASLLLVVSNLTFAGGILTNTNQHIAFLRMPARGASIDLSAVYSNPAGVAFMQDGFHIAVNGQSAYQSRDIHADFSRYGVDNFQKEYKGKASAPLIPSFQAVYKQGDWAISGSLAVTGGGGKIAYDDGLAMFDAIVMATISQASSGAINPDMYTLYSSMDGKQLIYGAQLGLSYRLNDNWSFYAGGRMNYVSSGYKGTLDAEFKKDFQSIPAELPNIALDCDQTGWGVTPIVGVHFAYNKWNVGLKYEMKANLNIENKTKVNSDPDGVLSDYKHGVNTPNDIPALLTAAVGYEILPKLRAAVEYHYFFDKDARMAPIAGTNIGKQKSLTGNTQEFLLGVEWDVLDRLTISAGGQKTDYGLSDDFQIDTSFYLDSYSFGLGAALKLSDRATMNIAYFWTDYSDYTKRSENYCGTGLSGTNVYVRTNKVFGLGLDYRF